MVQELEGEKLSSPSISVPSVHILLLGSTAWPNISVDTREKSPLPALTVLTDPPLSMPWATTCGFTPERSHTVAPCVLIEGLSVLPSSITCWLTNPEPILATLDVNQHCFIIVPIFVLCYMFSLFMYDENVIRMGWYRKGRIVINNFVRVDMWRLLWQDEKQGKLSFSWCLLDI